MRCQLFSYLTATFISRIISLEFTLYILQCRGWPDKGISVRFWSADLAFLTQIRFPNCLYDVEHCE